MSDPFDFSTTDPNAPGLLGLPVGTWQDLARFGGNLAAAANARTATGHLANGTGLAGSLGAATTATMDQGRQNAIARAGLAKSAAETQGMQIQNTVNASGLPLAVARNRMLLDFYNNPQQMQQLLGQASGVGPQSTAGPAGLGASEGGNNPAAVNSAGYSGQYQFGAPRLAELGLYQPAQGEPLNSNKWTGQFSIPGFPDVKTQADFLKNPQAQNAAYQIHMGNINQAIQSTPGAAGLDPNGLRAVAHLGGVQGMQKFIASGGQYNPADSNGTHLSDYYQKFSGHGAANPAAGPRAQPPGSYQVAQAGSGVPPGPTPQQPTSAPASDAVTMGNQFLQRSAQLRQQADALEKLKGFGYPAQGDPASIRANAQDFQTRGLALLAAGPQAAAESRAKAPTTLERAPPGTILFDANGRVVGSSPHEVTEVATEGPNKGRTLTALRSPVDNSIIGGADAGIVKSLSPQEHGALENIPTIQRNFIEHDNKVVDEDLSHVIENVIPAKQQLFQLRSLNPDANTGAAGEFRMNFKNWVQTFAPAFAEKVSVDASPAQEFKKIALMGAGKQERGDLGARGGFRAIELYLHANPSLENQPTANRDMANALLVSHQMHEDYATGATDFFNKQVQGVQNAQEPKPYTKLSVYDQQFIQKMRPELYAASIAAINGKPYAEWSKGLTGPQMQIVGGILQRADPSAQINIQGRMVPVSAFKTTISPMDIMGGGGGR